MRVAILGQCGAENLSVVSVAENADGRNRVRNKAKLRPYDLADPRNTALRTMLQKAEFSFLAGDDIVNVDEDDGPTGSASDSE
jgi:uncharacterized protein